MVSGRCFTKLIPAGVYDRPRDWIVPRRGMCAAFWCAIILILTSIVLLVMSKHKGRLYQSWGAVLLGCGCCIQLVCIILCIHAYCVMSAMTRRQKYVTDSRMYQQHQPFAFAASTPLMSHTEFDQQQLLAFTNHKRQADNDKMASDGLPTVRYMPVSKDAQPDLIYDDPLRVRESRMSSDSTNTSSDTQQQSSSASGSSDRMASSPIRRTFCDQAPPIYEMAIVHHERQPEITTPVLHTFPLPPKDTFPLQGDYSTVSSVVSGAAICRVKPLASDSDGGPTFLQQKYGTTSRISPVLQPSNPPPKYNASSLPINRPDKKFSVKFTPHISENSATVAQEMESNMSTTARQHDAVIAISRQFGPGTVTVTPLTARRLKALAPTSHQQSACRVNDITSAMRSTSFATAANQKPSDDLTESKATVYDNVQTLSV